MLIIIFLAYVSFVTSNNYIGIYQSHIIHNVKISFAGLDPFRLHYENNRTKLSDWKQQSDGISLIISPSTSSSSHIKLWRHMIKLFDTIPAQSVDYNIELSECPKPLYMNQLNFFHQCKSANTSANDASGSKKDDEYFYSLDGINYKDITKHEITDDDSRNPITFGFQKSCFHDYTIQPWISHSKFQNTDHILTKFEDLNIFNKFYKLILVPKLLEIRYNFNKRLINLAVQELGNSVIITELYWFNIQYDGTKVTITFLSKFNTQDTEALKQFKFVTHDLDIVYNTHISDKGEGFIHQSITGSGSHKRLNIKLSHTHTGRTLKIVHYLDNSFFVDPAEVLDMTNDYPFIHENCIRNTSKQFDNIRVISDNIENMFNDSSVQKIEVTICPQNNNIEYSLPIHARYMPICKLGKDCTGYEYSLLTVPNVYYSSNMNEDIVLFDNIQLAQLLKFTYEVSFIKYMASGKMQSLTQHFVNTFIKDIDDSIYWGKIVMGKKDTLIFKRLSVNYALRTPPNAVEFEEDNGNIYSVSTLTRGTESYYLLITLITILTSLTLTTFTIALLIIGSTSSTSFMYKITVKMLYFIKQNSWNIKIHSE
ncbi:hypothetical protein BMR1_01G02750 [Babesia microti strain RI]|uniref:Uncharacterized protein n=1 Tax=Babesia microti (strain RI) TaxID=1133968 RepID=A0A1N6LX18_BABMR|nr:hypothetical protein BMR1_01G02750 [Babesia microti strain RI]SIO73412.1 hypothetical protein BMR1_01G02750 [Babesia microti strain RI]|eukprot:XP_012647613.2 hypothetical protein BMR1_01G02750 [Babesia microti strain RI]